MVERVKGLAALAAAGAMVALAALPDVAGAASGRNIERLDTSGLGAMFPHGKVFRDRVHHGHKARAATDGFTETHTSADGYAVQVTISPSIPPTDANRAAAQSFVDLLASN